MHTFKLGDYVRYVNKVNAFLLDVGKTGIVIGVNYSTIDVAGSCFIFRRNKEASRKTTRRWIRDRACL